MEVDSSPSNQTGLLYAVETNNSDLASQLLEELANVTQDTAVVAERLEELTDFLDMIPRTEFPESSRKILYERGIDALCRLVHASDPDVLRTRSALLLSYLVCAQELKLPQLSGSLWLMWLADHSAAEQALREHGLTNGREDIKLASIEELRKWVDAMKGRIAFRKFTPAVVKLLRDEAPSVRQAAYSLLVKFFAAAKQPARDDLMEVMKRNQFNEIVREKLTSAIKKEAGETDHTSESLIDHQDREPISDSSDPHTSIRAGEKQQIRFPKSTRPAPTPVSAPGRPTSSASSNSVSPASTPYVTAVSEFNRPIELECTLDPSYPMQDITPQDVDSDETFVAQISKLVSCFDGKETEHNWSGRQNSIQTYRAMLRSSRHRPSRAAMRDGFKLLQRGISDALLSMRTTLVIDTCQAVKDTAQLMSQSPTFFELFDPLLESLTKVATGIKKITAAAANLTICAILIESPGPSNRQFSAIAQEFKNLKPHARAYAFYWLKASFLTSSISAWIPRQADLVPMIVKAVTDAAPTGRTQGRDLFWTMELGWPELAQKVSQRLSPSALRALQSNKVSTVNSAAPPSPVISSTAISGISSAQKTQLRPLATPAQPSPTGSIPQSANNHHSQASPRPRLTTANNVRSPSVEAPLSPFNRSESINVTPEKLSSRASIQTPVRTASQTSSHSPPSQISSPRHDLPHNELIEEPPTQSIADLSMKDLNVDADYPDSDNGSSPESPVDFSDNKCVYERSKRDVVQVLRQLAVSTHPADFIRAVLNVIKSANPELSTASAIATVIQKDVDTSSQQQREGYLKLLRLLDYEQETSTPLPKKRETESFIQFPYRRQSSSNMTTPRATVSSSGNTDNGQSDRNQANNDDNDTHMNYPMDQHNASIRDLVYVDSESGENDSTASAVSTSSSSVSNISMLTANSNAPKANQRLAKSGFVDPFPQSPQECKTQIGKMIDQVKLGTCDAETLASLSVLVTAASTSAGSQTSPLYTAVSIWRQHYTLDMQLRDAILPFLNRDPAQTNTEQIIVALVLLRALITCDSVPHAAVYLSPVACFKTLCTVSANFSHMSLEIDEHLLPDLSTQILQRLPTSLKMHDLVELFGSYLGVTSSSTAQPSGPKVFCLKSMSEAFKQHSPTLDDADRQTLIRMVITGIDNNDSRVRKEVYPLLLSIHRFDASLAESAASKLSSGQHQLFKYYVDADSHVNSV